MSSQSLLGAIDYIKGMRLSNDPEELMDNFHTAVLTLGFGGVVVLNAVQINKGVPIADSYYSRVPKVWSDYYIMNSLIEYDPVIDWCINGGFPARWADIKNDNMRDNIVFKAAENHGYPDGVTLPIHLAEHISIVSGMGNRVIDPTTFVIFNHIARYAAIKMHLLINKLEAPSLDDPRIKPIDRSILYLRLANKEISEIAAVLNITPNTVHNRINKMMDVTGTNTKLGPALVLQGLGII